MSGVRSVVGRPAPTVLTAAGGGVALIALAVILTLARAPLIVTSKGLARPLTYDAINRGDFRTCQENEVLPQGTTAIRLWIRSKIGPRVSVTAWSGSRIVAHGAVGTGWTGILVTVPVEHVSRTISDVRVCYAVGRATEAIGLIGEGRASSEAYGRTAIEYLQPERVSWWSLRSVIAQHMGLGRAPAGAWAYVIPIVLMLVALLVVLATTLRRVGWERPGGTLAGALLCTCVACLSAASWSILTPPFEVPDEPAHFAAAQYLAETGTLSRSPSGTFSPEEVAALSDLQLQSIRFNPAIGTISTAAQQQRLQHDLALRLSRVGQGVWVAATQPPLYYALQTIPYELGSGGTLLDRLALMRLLSSLFAGLTALFAFLFLRETLPAAPWAWTVGGLCAALAPLVGFMSGAVNPDSLLCAVSAALFYCVARAFRRGFAPRAAIAIGVVSAIGFLTKLNFIGLVPGLLLALLLLTRRARRASPRTAYRSLALALAIGSSPVCVYAVLNLSSRHHALGLLSRSVNQTSGHSGSLWGELAYIWEYFLPRLPGMPVDFPGISTIRQIWFDRSVGLYGWTDTFFSGWVYEGALIVAVAIALLAGRELVRERVALRARLDELCSYAAIGIGIPVLVGADAYLEFPKTAGGYSEPRYLLPLAALFAAVLALAARGAGRRWGPAVGALLVLLLFAHDLFSQLLVVGRYYI